jgi:hypothetical protein
METIGQTQQTAKRDGREGSMNWRCWAVTMASAVGGSLVVWSISRLGDVDLIVRSGDDRRTVALVSVLIMSALAAAAGLALLRILQQRMNNGRAVWTGIASVVFLLSLVGPLGAVTTGAAIVLIGMHTAVYASLMGTAWRRW